jgi:NAD(P)-dependent dehydrogenase (short-subunit alcohol dehydrogenase family)
MSSAFDNHNIVLIGATSGIAKALARSLDAQGARLFLMARDEQALAELQGETGAAGTAPVDATSLDAVEAGFAQATASLKRIDGVVNCVGSVMLKPAHLTSAHEWHNVIDTNLTSAFATARCAAKTMTDGGSVVLISTAAARVGLANHEAIAAAKAGVEGLARSAAATYAAKGLRFNVVAPGLVQTPATERITANEAARKASLAMHPLGRLGEPEDIASAIAWLLHRDQSWVTGQVIGVDGGLGALKTRSR